MVAPWRHRQRHTQRQIRRQRQRHSRRKSSHIYKFKNSVQQWIYIDKQCHGITFDKDKKKDKDKDKDKVTERPNMCYIFENDKTQGCQIWRRWVNQWCITEVNATEVMHQRWCTRGDAPGEMHRGRCTGGDAPGEMHHGRCTRGDALENFGVPKISKIP